MGIMSVEYYTANSINLILNLAGEMGLQGAGERAPKPSDFQRGERRTTSSGSEACPGAGRRWGRQLADSGSGRPRPFIPLAPLYLLATL